MDDKKYNSFKFLLLKELANPVNIYPWVVAWTIYFLLFQAFLLYSNPMHSSPMTSSILQ